MNMNSYDPDMMLSKNFRLGEFIKSKTAQEQGIDNTPSWEVVLHLRHLCQEVLQPLRNHYGRPIIITSGYRCPLLNEAVHGVGDSQHLYGCAADLHVADMDTAREWYHWLVTHADFDQLLVEYNRYGTRWLHVSCKPERQQNRHMAFFNWKSQH